MNKKAFQVVVVGSMSILTFKTGSKLYMPMQVEFSEQHALLGTMLKQELYHTTPMMGVIASANLKEDGSHDVSVILIDSNGEPIPGDNVPFKMKTFNATATDRVGLDQWCDDRVAVEAICHKKNKQSNAGIKSLIETLLECQNFNTQANRLIEKAMPIDDDLKINIKTVIEEGKKSEAEDYFNNEESEEKED